MINQILTLTNKLISIPSVCDGQNELGDILNLSLSELNDYTVEIFEKDGIKSALIYNSSKRPKKFKILLNAHLDTLPGKNCQYIPRIANGKLYSLGAMDMKASAACMITVFKQIANQVTYPLALQLTTDEEPGGFNGTKYQIDQGVRADFVIAGESTGLNIVNKAKGVVWMKITTTGKTAHSAYPWKGVNAITKMSKLLQILEERYPTPAKESWVTTINVSRIETTNNTFNKIPDQCEAWLDIRYIPKDKNIINVIKKLLPKGFAIEVIESEQPLNVNNSNLYIKRLRESTKNVIGKKPKLYNAQGTSDARHFAKVNCDSIEFGPVGGGIGSDNEWVSIESLQQYQAILKNFLLDMNKQ